MDKVYEGVANVAGVIVVDWQVKKVELKFMILVDLLQEHVFGVFVRNMPDHYRGPAVGLDLALSKLLPSRAVCGTPSSIPRCSSSSFGWGVDSGSSLPPGRRGIDIRSTLAK